MNNDENNPQKQDNNHIDQETDFWDQIEQSISDRLRAADAVDADANDVGTDDVGINDTGDNIGAVGIGDVDFDPDSQSDERVSKKKSLMVYGVPLYVIVIAAVALIVIIFAFVMEANSNRDSGSSRGSRLRLGSEVQLELDELNWVEQEFLPLNEYSRPGTRLEQVNGIVIHNIGNPGTTAMQNRNFFANLAITHETKVSSNFIVCLDGTILQCVPVDEVAYASNERNDDTISIEVCHPDDTGQFTHESYISAIRLTAWLCDKFGLTTDDVIRHYDVQGKECPRYFVENEDAWETFRADVEREME